MKKEDIKPNLIVRGSIFAEPVQVITSTSMGNSIKLIGKGLNTGRVHEPILDDEKIAELEASPEKETFDGDSSRFRLGVEALRLGIAYEYDPYFSLSIARVDPLPHQLEAVYDYFLPLPRIRFLLADDPGAGKTIMAGLLLKELKIRGLVKRTLIVTPANLTFQWQRELIDKFREKFEIMNGDILRTNYGSNPWQEKDQVITSVHWVSKIEDARESLLTSQWDLIIVDEAHKMSAYSSDKKTLAYRLGEKLSDMTDHFLLMTATPHKGDPKNFCLFLELLDRDVYGDVASLEEAMKRNEAPFYLRRTKEALVTFPDPVTGKCKKLFTDRKVQTIEFQIDDEEFDFYDELTHYVDEQSAKASADVSPRGRAVGFIMAMLQRRFASSIYAVRKSLERMRDKREKILKDPEAYRRSQINKRLPDDFEEYTEKEQQEIITELESTVLTIDPTALKEDIQAISRLIDHAKTLEKREVESKLTKLKEVLNEQGIFDDPKMKLLLFTEHKETLDFLVEKLESWGLTVTQIHGGMKIGSLNEPGTRIYAEKEFRENAQVMVATEAAGEGINLQFCWFMINYDIPWNPVRLEQRMGRIHRYGQEKDCLIFNFVSINTREGRVLQKLFERISQIENDLDPTHSGKIFNVLGDIFPSNQLEKMLREMYSQNLTEDAIKKRIVEQVDIEKFRQITNSALEGLAKRELNLTPLIGKSSEAKEKRLVPEVIEDFFVRAGPIAGISPTPMKKKDHVYRIGKVPRTLWSKGDALEVRFGKLAHEYKNVIFDKGLLTDDPTFEWVTPGHPLFESVRVDVLDQVQKDMKAGTVFFDLNREFPSLLDVFSAAVLDGMGHVLHRKLFVVETLVDGSMEVHQPTIFAELLAASKGTEVPEGITLPEITSVESFLIEKALNPFLEEISAQRKKEITTISKHVDISLNTIIDRAQISFAELLDRKESGFAEQGIEGRLQQLEDKLSELNNRRDNRLEELEREKQCTIAEIQHHGRALVLPHPERKSPDIAPMVRDDEIERIAVEYAMNWERARGWVPESVEKENRGFDLISRRMHPEDPKTSIDVRFIEVKGRNTVGEVVLSTNEYNTAERLKDDYWLYVVYNCSSKPELHAIQNPAKLGWKPLTKIEHYHLGADEILNDVRGR